MLRLLFMGSPELALPSLRVAQRAGDVRAVVSQPDRPSGRGRELTPPPVAVEARALGLPLLQPPGLRRPELQDALRAFEADLFVVVAYGRILPSEVLSIPRLGCINVHASLLPKYRGAAPIQWALLEGERETGVSIMQLDEGLDTGPVYLRRALRVEEDDTAGSLFAKLALLGAEALQEALAGIEAGTLIATPQDATRATPARRLEKEDGRIDFRQPAEAVRNRVRAVDPWPGAYTDLDGEALRLFGARRLELERILAPGEVAGLWPEGLVVGCGDGLAVAFAELQLPGRRRMTATALSAGRPIPPGSRLGRSGDGSDRT